MARFRTPALLTVLVMLGSSMSAGAVDIDPTVPSVALGSGYFATQPGTHFNFGGGVGDVNLIGLPIGPFNTSAIIQRRADAVLGGPAIPIQMLALSLKSAAPVNVGGSFFDVFITLDPPNLANDTGTMSIAGNTITGGTFSSAVNVFFQAHFAGAGSAFDVFSQVNMVSLGTAWGPDPPAGAVIVNGPDDGTRADELANKHSGLLCTAATGACEVDFFLATNDTTWTSSTSTGNFVFLARNATTPPVPEPGSLLLLSSGIIALGLRLKWRRR